MAKDKTKKPKKIMDENWDEIQVLRKSGVSIAEVAKQFGLAKTTLSDRLAKNIIPVTNVKTHESLNLTGLTTLYDGDGNIKQQYVKEGAIKGGNLEAFRETVEAFLTSDRIVASNKFKNPSSIDSDTMSIYSIGDAHVGMLAWGKETGEDYDSAICIADHLSAMDLLVEQAHPSKECFIIDTGDFTHMDSQANTTTKGTRVDVDSRFAKVLGAALDLAVAMTEKALTKHEIVNWRSAIGNHNEHTAIMMSAFIKAWFRNEARVIVHDTPSLFMYHTFGKNLIGITHGHTAKAEKLGEVMSVDCKNEWSASEHRYWYTGHVHHQTVKEFTNCVVETFNTLTSKDAWHAGMGYRSKQSMKSITLHKEYGEISRNTVSQALVRAHQRKN